MGLIIGGLVLLPLAEFVPGTWQAGWLLGTYFLAFLGALLYLTMSSVFLMAATGPAERDHAFSMQWAVQPLASFAGALVGGTLPGPIARALGLPPDAAAPYRYSLLFGALALIPAVPLLLATREPVRDQSGGRGTASGRPPYGLIALMGLFNLLSLAGEFATRTFFNVYLDAGLGVPTSQIGVLLGVGHLLSVPVAMAAPVVMARCGRYRSLIWGALGMAVGLLPLALIPRLGAAGVGYATVIAMSTIVRSANGVFMMALVAPKWRPAMTGGLTMGAGLSGAAVGMGGGFAIAALGYPTFFLGGGALTASSALLLWAVFRGRRAPLAQAANAEGVA
jgi:hypothetical protein